MKNIKFQVGKRFKTKHCGNNMNTIEIRLVDMDKNEVGYKFCGVYPDGTPGTFGYLHKVSPRYLKSIIISEVKTD